MTRQSMAVRGKPGAANAGAGDGKVEGVGTPHLTVNSTPVHKPAGTTPRPISREHPRATRPIYRCCPSCRLQARAGEFQPVRAPRGVGGFAWRQCPRCGHVGTLAGFSRVDGDGQRVGVGRAVRR